MKCEVCGMEYGVSHSCGGPRSPEAQQISIADMTPPVGAGAAYYLGEAWKIVRWDDLAIRKNSKDAAATTYGVLFWLASMLLILAIQTYPAMKMQLANASPAALAAGMVFGLGLGIIAMGLITFLQLGLCHLIAKVIFGANGRFVELMRPLLLGWFVNCLVLIPGVGMFLAGIGWTAVLMMVFEEVDGIGRLQAFGVSAGINVCLLAIQIAMMPTARHL